MQRKYTVDCCDKLKEEVKEDYIFSIMTNFPFTKKAIEVTMFILSDSGHGGVEEIYYCPFCGKKLEFILIENKTK